MAKKPEDNRTPPRSIRVEKEEWERWQKWAEDEGLPLSTYIRQIMRQEGKRRAKRGEA